MAMSGCLCKNVLQSRAIAATGKVNAWAASAYSTANHVAEVDVCYVLVTVYISMCIYKCVRI